MATAKKPTRKPDAQPEASASEAPAPSEPQPAAVAPTGGTYAEQAAQLAADARALADAARRELADLTGRCAALGQTDPGAGGSRVADSVRRVPTAIDDATRALAGLSAAAADLTMAALR